MSVPNERHVSLRARINSFVESVLGDHSARVYRSSKVIHDSLWGTNRYYEHELAVIDCPLFQRLRYLHQTGLAFFAYPSLTHSRFEHSLGMVTVVTRLLSKLRERHRDSMGNEPLCSEPRGRHAELRLAALIHDLGHGFLSHVSEEIYKSDPEILELQRLAQFSHAKASEIFAYLIVTSPAFQNFFNNTVPTYVPEVNLEVVANLIVGKADPKEHYLAQIINGSLDADKIDYISRDTFYSGVTTTIDVDRLFNDLSIYGYQSGLQTLVLSGPLPLERILFSKMLLYTTIYHHQKVKAADCMVEGLLEYVHETEGASILGYSFKDPIDFLRVSDTDLFSAHASSATDPFKKKTICNLISRNLLQRCLVLSRETVDNYGSEGYYHLNKLSKSPKQLRELRQKIVDNLPSGTNCNIHEVWLCLPEQPSLREASQTLALLAGEKEPVKLNDIFPLDGWLRAFSDNKWKGYVFAPAHAQSAVHKSAREVLESLGLRLNAKSSAYAHVESEV
jgi:HD superfamily phosphohydrolase